MPASFQSSLLRFHEAIKLVNMEENAKLRDKREIVLNRLRERGLKFAWFNQGSYAMNTGVEPIDKALDYDIDVGIVFSEGARPHDPLELKERVFGALGGFNVEWRRNCIRVQYVKARELAYHVDLPVYWRNTGFWDPGLFLAVGKRHSSADKTQWQRSDPEGLIKLVNETHSGEDAAQFRRVVRYMKRWKDYRFPIAGNAAPPGVGLTVAALRLFTPSRMRGAKTQADYDDLAATRDLVGAMMRAFQSTWHDGSIATRLVQQLPVEPNTDIFARMTNQQMSEFYQRLATLARQLDDAVRTGYPESLADAFGGEFLAVHR